nr:MAG TPA: hypothetical protein [Bacteriophage sp.]
MLKILTTRKICVLLYMEMLIIAFIVLYIAYKCNNYGNNKKKNNFKNRYKDENL